MLELLPVDHKANEDRVIFVSHKPDHKVIEIKRETAYFDKPRQERQQYKGLQLIKQENDPPVLKQQPRREDTMTECSNLYIDQLMQDQKILESNLDDTIYQSKLRPANTFEESSNQYVDQLLNCDRIIETGMTDRDKTLFTKKDTMTQCVDEYIDQLFDNDLSFEAVQSSSRRQTTEVPPIQLGRLLTMPGKAGLVKHVQVSRLDSFDTSEAYDSQSVSASSRQSERSLKDNSMSNQTGQLVDSDKVVRHEERSLKDNSMSNYTGQHVDSDKVERHEKQLTPNKGDDLD